MEKEEFRSRLMDNVLLFDGAMGTMLYAAGVYVNRCFDELNLTEPARVADIHRKYVNAGADVIETNSYGANRLKLQKFGLEDQVRDINLAAVRIAREAVGRNILVAGSMGPATPPLRTASQKAPEILKKIYNEQANVLEEGGVDLFIVETISDMDEMAIAISAIKNISNKPIIAQATFTDQYRTIYDDKPADVAKIIREAGADAVGLNCSIGPRDSLEVLKMIVGITDLPISVQPNAGMPKIVDGRYIYLTTPEYMAEYAKRFIQHGASIIGGCCGTTPEHIKAMRGAIRALKPKKIEFFIGQTGIATVEMEEVKTVPTIEKSPFARKLREKFAVCVEVIPPKSISIEKTLERVEILRARGVDVVNIPDGPRASMRMSPIALAAMIENRTKMETILHYTCRDRNILGMQSDLLGAHILGLRNFLIVTGDPPRLGDYPDATAVYDVDSVGLVRILTKFNNGKDIVGNPAGKPAAFHIGVGANPGAINIQLEKERLEEKIKGGAEFILTQPVYSARILDDFLSSVNIKEIPVLVGILPLASLKMAEFLTYEVPGMAVPEHIRDRLRKAGTKEAEKEIGIEVAREALKESRTVKAIKGVYIMLPAGGIETAFEIIKVL